MTITVNVNYGYRIPGRQMQMLLIFEMIQIVSAFRVNKSMCFRPAELFNPLVFIKSSYLEGGLMMKSYGTIYTRASI